VSLQFFPFGNGAFFGPQDGISVKAHFSDRGALLLGAALSLDESTGKSSPSEMLDRINNRYYTVTVTSQIQEYVDARGPVTIFLALGPYWNRARSSYEETRQSPAATIQNYKSERKSWEVGATGGVGFEWFFKRKLSVVGRVGASLALGKEHETFFLADDLSNPNTYSLRKTDYSTFTSSSASSALGLAVYF